MSSDLLPSASALSCLWRGIKQLATPLNRIRTALCTLRVTRDPSESGLLITLRLSEFPTEENDILISQGWFASIHFAIRPSI